MAAARYRDELLAEINADREAHGKKPFDNDDPPKGTKRRDNTSRKKLARRKKEEKGKKTVTVSTTDPECGIFRKEEHKRCFAYEAHTAPMRPLQNLPKDRDPAHLEELRGACRRRQVHTSIS